MAAARPLPCPPPLTPRTRRHRESSLHRTQEAGLGAAYVAGFARGLSEGYDVLVEMDADGSHDPAQLPRLLAALGGPEGADLALGIWLHDATGGYRAYRRAVLEGIDLATVASQGYCFQVDLAWRALQAGFRVVEVPIVFTEREHGQSKMDGSVVGEALWRVAVRGLEQRWARARALLGASRSNRRAVTSEVGAPSPARTAAPR